MRVFALRQFDTIEGILWNNPDYSVVLVEIKQNPNYNNKGYSGDYNKESKFFVLTIDHCKYSLSVVSREEYLREHFGFNGFKEYDVEVKGLELLVQEDKKDSNTNNTTEGNVLERFYNLNKDLFYSIILSMKHNGKVFDKRSRGIKKKNEIKLLINETMDFSNAL